MHLDLELTSEDYEQFTAKIISKYQPLNTTLDISKADRIDKQIQDFAQKLCGMYQKFYPVVRITHYQHGMYLALINSKRSNSHSFHEKKINENHKIFREYDTVHWLHLCSTTFEALLMNFRKLIIDTSRGEGKAISMIRIRKDIENFHTNMKADTDEFTQFIEDLNQQIEIAKAPEREKLWDYILAYNIHLQDKFPADTYDQFHVIDLEILMDCVNNFINVIYGFYNYKEPAYTADIGYQKTERWISAFGSFKQHSMGMLSRYINALAQLSICSEYVNLTPKEASEKIFQNVVLENEADFELFRYIVQGHLKKRIEALKEESDKQELDSE